MSVLNTAARLAAGKSASPFLQEAERLLSPKGFFSKLEEAVAGLNFNKMPSQQLRKTMEGRQVSPLEYDNVLGHMEGTVSKEEVMNTISKNKTQFKDVVLGETDQSYQDILNKEVSRANEFLQMQDTDIRKEASRLAAGEPTDIITFAQMVSENKSYMPKGRYKISEEYLNKDDAKLPTHYEQWSEPGYVPGSYRERFVTAPPKEAPDNNLLQEGQTEWRDGHSVYSAIQNPVVRLRTNDRVIGGKPTEDSKLDFHDWIDKYRRDSWTDSEFMPQAERMKTRKAIADEYAKRPMVEGRKKILFVEEIQGPSASEQAKMPEFLRKRIYDIGVKKALMIAKEGGYDGVAWTTGEMQASRYNLSKHVDKVTWGTASMSGEKVPTIYLKDHTPIHIEMDNKGIIRGTSEGSFVGEKLENVIGQEIAKKILTEDSGELKGLDLKVGGEGLKYLYDKQLPSLFKKYGKENVSIINIEHQNPDLYSKDRLEGRPILTSVPYIPITQKTPSRHPVYSLIPPTLTGIMSMYNRDKDNGT